MISWILALLRSHQRDWTIGVIILVIAVTVSANAQRILLGSLKRLRPNREGDSGGHSFKIVARIRRPAQALVILTGVGIILPLLGDVPPHYLEILQKALAVLWFLSLGWLLVALVYCAEDFLMMRYDISVSNNLRARRARTQMQLMRRMVITLLIMVDAGLILSVFRDSQMWHYGAGLLASAGLASLVLATAAKTSASNFLAGLQIAITEPIRLDDVVIVEGQWGRIEEITTTYVIVAIWDQRRLVVPLTYFIETPFENWTRNTSDLLGTSFLYVDYSVPVEALRQEFTRVLEESPLWDKRVNALQVTNLSEHTMEIRCLLSAADSSRQFDLRCIVREKMIAFIQKNYPDAFPRTRFSAISRLTEKTPAENDGHLAMQGFDHSR
ncbi:small-conductance mechanosensitive channel [Silvibacterium bohemicum]|uniref:Small-conductance mechanosensitive channel n=1 Tax=Silvibacterium bohemicum TaxID=1577686 RepID=A0A841JLD4_9BACT|nr:mechanosensitive ion channel domain-containing protein [Silvibacterium bohemicum]MBB6142156.1 small-conductance mechanosensitive channel [Silvibacterium bohemicum]